LILDKSAEIGSWKLAFVNSTLSGILLIVLNLLHILFIFWNSSATNRLITAKDHASVQLNIGHLDSNGIYTGSYTPVALSGYVRAQGESDSALNRIAAEAGLIKNINQFPKEHNYKKE
jgi:small subunit ribosomal protein S21e